jgi:predicted amidohydrolase
MQEFTFSTIQQQVRIFDTPLAYQSDIFRFLQMARAKDASLVVLPALSPLMLVPPLASEAKLDQLKQQEEGRGGISNLVGKLFGRSSTTAEAASGGVKEELRHLLAEHPGEIYDAYIDLFSAAALKYQMTIVAGSFYLRENEETDCTHVAYVFAPNGMVLGRQEKIHLAPHETDFCQAGEVLQVIETPVGQLGILIEEDALYPECGRILAYHGAEILVHLSACAGKSIYNQLRNAFLARVDENEVLGIQSCLIGRNLMETGEDDLVGKSALLQPFQLSPFGDGILYEVGSLQTEGFIAERVSLEGLKDYWVRPQPRLRQSMAIGVFQPLAKIYRDRRTIDQLYWNPPEDEDSSGEVEALAKLDFLPAVDEESATSEITSPFVADDDE